MRPRELRRGVSEIKKGYLEERVYRDPNVQETNSETRFL